MSQAERKKISSDFLNDRKIMEHLERIEDELETQSNKTGHDVGEKETQSNKTGHDVGEKETESNIEGFNVDETENETGVEGAGTTGKNVERSTENPDISGYGMHPVKIFYPVEPDNPPYMIETNNDLFDAVKHLVSRLRKIYVSQQKHLNRVEATSVSYVERIRELEKMLADKEGS